MNPFNKIRQWYLSKGALPYWCIFLIDCLIVFSTQMLVQLGHHGGLNTLHIFWHVVATSGLCVCCYAVGFRLLHTYANVVRYSSFVDLYRVTLAVLVGLVLTLAVAALVGGRWIMARFTWVDLTLAALLSLVAIWAVRVVVKGLYDTLSQSGSASRVFIYGVSQGGVGLAKSIRNQESSPFTLAGFVADSGDVSHGVLMGARVYPNDENLLEEMRRKCATALLVSPLKSESLRENEQMVSRLTEGGVKIYMIPTAKEWRGNDEVSHENLKEVDIEDLLPRDQIVVDLEATRRLLSGSTVLITGAAGSIGSEIVRQVSEFGPAKLVLVDQAETPLHDIRLMMSHRWPGIKALTLVADIANQARMEGIMRANRPDYVFHAAAYKHVPMMEDNPTESVQTNVEGTRIVADLSVKYGVRKFVMISTDKAVNPTNVMGCSKRICEIYVQSLNQALASGQVAGSTLFVTTRFGNVLGSNGSVIPLFKEQIRSGGPVTVTHPDIVRYFMLIPEACKLVLEACTMGRGGEIFAFDMGKPVRIADLAKRMIKLSGAKGVEIKFTGLRSGEKLYEEVLSDTETTLPTCQEKIRIAKVREYDYRNVCRDVGELVAASRGGDDMETVRLMKRIVPEYKSMHSIYQALD